MRPWLRLPLIISVVLSLVALIWWAATTTPTVSAASSQVADGGQLLTRRSPLQTLPGTTASPSGASSTHASAKPLPSQLPSPELEAAVVGDPFVGRMPPDLQPAQTRPTEPPPPPPPPTAPGISYRFLGRFVGPDGNALIYLGRADGRDVPISVGSRLDEGYVVEAITAEAVKLHYPPLNHRTSIAIPPAER